MKVLFTTTLAVGLLVIAGTSYSQSRTSKNFPSVATPMKYGNSGVMPEYRGSLTNEPTASAFPSSPLSSLVSIPGASSLGISGKWYTQGIRGLHNIQVDPDQPNNIHAVIMTAPNVTLNDTIGSKFPTRNVFYTFSADGGATWKTAVKLNKFRSGYPDMVLYKRGGKYVPVIIDHQYISASSTNFQTSIFVETGNPGDGTFAEADCDRTPFSGGDIDIIWPTVAISPDGTTAYVLASVSPASGSQAYDYLQFGTFTLGANGTPSAWSGWKSGPGSIDGTGLSTAGQYAMRISPAGKIGVTWHNWDISSPDFGIYYSESTDGGQNWLKTSKAVYTNVLGDYPDPGSGGFYFRNGGGIDMMFDGETPVVVFDAYASQLNFGSQGSSYIPESGSLLYWRDGMTLPAILVSRADGHQTDLQPSLVDGSFLSSWVNTSTVDPQGPTVSNPTIAVSGIAKIWSIYYDAWANNDSSFDYTARTADNKADTTTVLPFHSIYRLTTTDNGTSWTNTPVRANDPSTDAATHVDYNFPSVSSYNVVGADGVTNYVVFAADSAAGEWLAPRQPGFDDVGYYFTTDKVLAASVHGSVAASSTLSIGNAYPSPSFGETTLPFELRTAGRVSVWIEDLLGRRVRNVYTGMVAAGEQSVRVETSGLPAGVYRCVVSTNQATVSTTISVLN